MWACMRNSGIQYTHAYTHTPSRHTRPHNSTTCTKIRYEHTMAHTCTHIHTTVVATHAYLFCFRDPKDAGSGANLFVLSSSKDEEETSKPAHGNAVPGSSMKENGVRKRHHSSSHMDSNSKQHKPMMSNIERTPATCNANIPRNLVRECQFQ